MHDDEFDEVRRLEVAAFGDDESIGVLLEHVARSWAWEPELSIVAEHSSEICAHVLFTRAIVDAPSELVDVLVRPGPGDEIMELALPRANPANRQG